MLPSSAFTENEYNEVGDAVLLAARIGEEANKTDVARMSARARAGLDHVFLHQLIKMNAGKCK